MCFDINKLSREEKIKFLKLFPDWNNTSYFLKPDEQIIKSIFKIINYIDIKDETYEIYNDLYKNNNNDMSINLYDNDITNLIKIKIMMSEFFSFNFNIIINKEIKKIKPYNNHHDSIITYIKENKLINLTKFSENKSFLKLLENINEEYLKQKELNIDLFYQRIVYILQCFSVYNFLLNLLDIDN